ncbi:arginyltransferase [Motilimonas pumila]|uniref:Aspartate/glutamate leucyltransferase n=1 Tax=Motilimonas pumila TaxID=2303987 RepID=A0A418YGG8_9GAMM|nr:arginyltransferase [Motilimonas pumila]RJG48721.1 arginyltransferase [Motilimonas pumila]
MLEQANDKRNLVLKVGITPESDCSYLPDKQEQLLVLMDATMRTAPDYEQLLALGFRRSGDDLYRPHCASCHACQSVRVDCSTFKPSKSQKRLLNKNKDLSCRVSRTIQPHYYALYEKYINLRHADGSMFPATEKQYQHFVICHWLAPCFIEIYHEQTLIAVAVTDDLPHSCSAMYTFYDPDYETRSLGSYAILQQILFAQSQQKRWLYLGFQVDDCRKMNYKTRFKPYERLIKGEWHNFANKVAP